MNSVRTIVASALVLVAGFASVPALALDKLSLVVVGLTSWDSSPAVFGKKLGFFADAGIDLDIASTESTNDNLKALVAGSADVGVVNTPGFIGAALQGAPVKMIASIFKGYPDILWYVRSDSKLQSLKDVTPETTIGVSAIGTSTFIALSALLEQYGVKGTIVPVGNNAAGMTQVMAGELEAGSDGNGLLGVPQWNNKEVRVLAYGRELTGLADVTVRGLVARTETVAARRDVLVRFLQALQRSIDWMYSHPEAVQWFADQTQSTLAEAQRVVENSYPRPALNVAPVTGIEVSVKQGIDFKRIPRQPTEAELSAMFEMLVK